METSTTTKATTATVINHRSDTLAVLQDLRSPYIQLGTHPEWRPQFRRMIQHPTILSKLDERMKKLGRWIICYSKIFPDKKELLKLCDYDDATVCVISSVGEHGMTPWMIMHNVGHTIISNEMWVKKDVKKVLGLTPTNYRIYFDQQKYVTCGASRNMVIPNINELIYELFTTWAWHGETRSDHPALKEYCDKTFSELVEKYRNTMFWHKYRCPQKSSSADMAWMAEIIEEIEEEEPPLKPGVPGFTKYQMKMRQEDG